MDQYNKTPGSALFWGNRTKMPYLATGYHTFAPRATNPTSGYLFRYKKSDITIQPGWNCNPAGGFLIYNNVVPFAYESIEIGTGETGSGTAGTARITVTGGTFQNLDKITLGSRTIELRTDGQGGDYYNNSKWNISTGPLSTQLAEIASKFVNVVNYPQYLPEAGKITCTTDNATFLHFAGRRLDTSSNGLAFGVVSSNPNISITQGIASPVKALTTIQQVKFTAQSAGTAGNNLSITYTSGAVSSTPEVSTNGAGAIDIKIMSGTTNATQIINAVNANPSVFALVSASLVSGANGSLAQTSPVPATFLDGGTSHTMTPWIPGDKLKNCFIVSPKFMYGYNDVVASSITLSEVAVPANTVLYQTYHSLQVIPHPNYNMGAWFRKSVANKSATVRLTQGGQSYNGPYSYFELQLKGAAAGVAGNQYSFEIRNHPDIGLSNRPATNARFRLESNVNGANKKIVLILGLEGGAPNYTRSITDMNHFYDAYYNGDAGIKDILEPVSGLHGSIGINNPQSETFFTGGSASAGSDFVREGSADLVWGPCRFSSFGGSFAQGELGVDGKSKQADDTGNVLKTSGKMSGIFARVVPAGTPFKAWNIIGDLAYTAKTGGVAGNSITIKYNTGGTKGSEAVTVIGSAISVAIADVSTTAAEIKAAIDANGPASALVEIRIVGTPSNPQSVAGLTPSPVSLKDGAAALSKDSGYFITQRRNMGTPDTDLVNSNYLRNWEVLFSKDLSNPDSFQHVCWFNESHMGEPSVRGDRAVIEINDYYSNGQIGMKFNHYGQNTTFTTISNFRNILPKDAHLQSGNITFTSTIKGSDGNRAKRIKIEGGGTAGSELVTVSGNDITIKVQLNVSTVAQVQSAIAANSPASAAIIPTPSSGQTTTSVINITHDFVELNSGVEYWPHEGNWGFGYCNINEFSFVPDNATNTYNTVKRKSPRGWPGEMIVEAFRLSKLT